MELNALLFLSFLSYFLHVTMHEHAIKKASRRWEPTLWCVQCGSRGRHPLSHLLRDVTHSKLTTRRQLQNSSRHSLNSTYILHFHFLAYMGWQRKLTCWLWPLTRKVVCRKIVGNKVWVTDIDGAGVKGRTFKGKLVQCELIFWECR